jgi:hypothetical protein
MVRNNIYPRNPRTPSRNLRGCGTKRCNRGQVFTRGVPHMCIYHYSLKLCLFIYFDFFVCWVKESYFLLLIDWFIYYYGVRLRLWTAATNGHIHPPDKIWVWRTMVEYYWQGKTKDIGEKPIPGPLSPPQIPYGFNRARTRDSAVRGRRLNAWAMARPTFVYIICSY